MRDRPEDIPLLAAHFAQNLMTELGAPFQGFAPEAMAQLRAHNWPGNVRELKNVAERAGFAWVAADAVGPIDQLVIDPFERALGAAHTANPTAPDREKTTRHGDNRPLPTSIADLRAHLDAIERAAVETALAAHGGSQKRTAEALSLTYDQLRGIVRKHGLNSPAKAES